MPEPSFEWDQGKDWLNRVKHGVLFMAAQAAFFDPRRVIAEAPGAQRRGTPLLLLRQGRERRTHGALHLSRRTHPDFWRRLLAEGKENL
jgi:uncharacterized DUF497 family protein